MFETIEELKKFDIKKDGHIIACALNMWANRIETGETDLSAKQVEDAGHPELVHELNADQQESVARIRKLAREAMDRENPKPA